jgi:hypothetical protein
MNQELYNDFSELHHFGRLEAPSSKSDDFRVERMSQEATLIFHSHNSSSKAQQSLGSLPSQLQSN